MTTILADAAIGEFVTGCVRQAQRVIQLTIGQQPGVGGNRSAAKLKHQAAVEIEPQRTPIRFTRRVHHHRLVRSPTRC